MLRQFVLFALFLIYASCDGHKLGRRIVKGDVVDDPSKWPWLVSLVEDVPSLEVLGLTITSDSGGCGGSVIGDNWILSAAHCFEGIHGDPSYWTAHIGSLKIETTFTEKVKGFFSSIFNRENWKQWNIEIEKIIVHPNYDIDLILNDIALLKLKKPVPSGPEFERIQRVNLPRQGDMNFPTDGQECIAVGWGCTKPYGNAPPSEVLREVVLPIGSRDECSRSWRKDYTHSSMICAGLARGWEGTCPGDSGGPLMCMDSRKSWIQVGITSFGHDSAYLFRDVFTRVSRYTDWIRNTINNEM